jgi:hypothetical protein
MADEKEGIDPVSGDRHATSVPWSILQRRALVVVLSALTVYLLVLMMRHRGYVADPIPAEGSWADQLADRIDLNTADFATIAAIPTLGGSRAEMIIEYRQRAQAREPGMPVFRSPEDLLKVRGIGAAMLANLAPYIKFPAAEQAATTQP